MERITKNPDNDFIKEVRKQIKDNNGYCPCSLIKDEDHRCMCKEFRDMQRSGMCTCGLYVKEVTPDE